MAEEFNTERKTLIVIILTLVTMIAEIIVGYYTNSMALFADGCHMGTHALALLLTFLTYILIKKFSNSDNFVFGTGKFSTLSGFSSSILLGLTGVFIIKEGVERFYNPLSIELNEAILVTIIGFIVNFLCIIVMKDCGHKNCHHHKEDYNFKAAYFHILSDLMTSVLAMLALFAAKYAGWNFLDPIVGVMGGILICIWAIGLIKSTSMILLDSENLDLKDKILQKLYPEVKFGELHIWKISENEYMFVGKAVSNLEISEIKSVINSFAAFHDIILELKNDK